MHSSYLDFSATWLVCNYIPHVVAVMRQKAEPLLTKAVYLGCWQILLKAPRSLARAFFLLAKIFCHQKSHPTTCNKKKSKYQIIVYLRLTCGVFLGEVFQLRYLIKSQLPKFHTTSPCCCKTVSDFVSYFEIRNGSKR